MKTRAIVGVALAILLAVSATGLCDEAVMKTSPATKSRPGWLRRTFCNLSWDEAAATVTSPMEASARVRHRVRYEEDLDDKWAGGRETWERGYGDCEDIAACVAELCEKAGLDVRARIVVFKPEDGYEAHAATVGTWKGRYWMSSNGWFFRIDSLEQAKARIAKHMRWQNRKIQAVSLDDAVWPVTVAAQKRASEFQALRDAP